MLPKSLRTAQGEATQTCLNSVRVFDHVGLGDAEGEGDHLQQTTKTHTS